MPASRVDQCSAGSCHGETRCVKTRYGRRCLCPLGNSTPLPHNACPQSFPVNFSVEFINKLNRFDERTDLVRYQGKCDDVFKCGYEAGCRAISSGTFVCLCPEDQSQPIGGQPPDIICPTYQGVASSVRNPTIVRIRSNTTSQWTNQRQRDSAVRSDHQQQQQRDTSPLNNNLKTTLVPIGATLLIFVLFALFLLFFVRRYKNFKKPDGQNCSFSDKKKQTPAAPLSINMLTNFHSNPNYYHELDEMTTSMRVRILKRERITDWIEIGEGCFGKVYKATYVSEDGVSSTVAVKLIKNSSLPSDVQNIINEIEIMANCSHPNIISLIGLLVYDGEPTPPSMVFEYMTYGDLTELLRKREVEGALGLDVKMLHSFALQVAEGMAYLASQHFIHRDLACRNILVGENMIAKVSDFGMSRDVYTCDYYQVGTGRRMIPVRWMSPECLIYGKFTFEGDVWSYGVLLWEIFSYGKQPYYGHSNEEVVLLVTRNILLLPPDNCPNAVCDVMEQCWKSDPKQRASFATIVSLLKLFGDQIKNHNYTNIDSRTVKSATAHWNCTVPTAAYTTSVARAHSSVAVPYSNMAAVATGSSANSQCHTPAQLNGYLIPDAGQPIYLQTMS